MSRTQRLVHFDFWMNNTMILPFIIIFLGIAGILPSSITFILVLLTAFIPQRFRNWYHRSLGVKYNQFFYSGDDEREKNIALKTIQKVLAWLLTSCFLLVFSLPFILLFTANNTISIELIGLTLSLIFMVANSIYYVLWFKYDPQQ
ncbi:hypothetical protein [Pediococcus acidilactici]|uniref:hypothetical protein n=1 Tax=Pediococcus acidilactici TaxID=1254 RepID=UPI00137C2722|nr:hypothetical protein [Pediococcus acidilactici]QHS02863.1 hypothetical protein GWA24_03475 [Pediococcus acidilactici]